MKTLEFNNIADLKNIHTEWNELLNTTEGATFFQTLDWLEVYWKYFSAGQKLRVLAVEEQGQIVGILPLVVQKNMTKVGKLRYLTFPFDDWGSIYGPIGPGCQRWLPEAIEHVFSSERNWDVFELRCLHPEFTADSVHSSFVNQKIATRESVWNETAVLDFNGSFESFCSSQTSKWRNNLKKSERRVATNGEVQYLRYRPKGEQHNDADPRWDLYNTCVQIAEKSWQGTSDSGTTLCHPTVKEFFRESHEIAARLGCLDLNLLNVSDQPVAFAYNYVFSGNVYSLRMGFDSTVIADGAGIVIIKSMIQDSFDRADHSIDFGTGSLEYKRRWGTHPVSSKRLTHFSSNSPRAQLLNMNRWVKQQFASSRQ